jgi:hypothetical protein
MFKRLMLESKSCGSNFTIIIHNNISDILFTANSMMLTAVTLDSYLHKFFNLGIKIKYRNFITATINIPRATSVDKVIEWTDP